MASQRVTLAKIGGRAAAIVAEQFACWRDISQREDDPNEIHDAVDLFADQLRAHAHQPPVIYFSEWIDLWSMGDLIPGLGDRAPVICGKRYEACCHSVPVTLRNETIAGETTQESQWLRQRLAEAERAWQEIADNSVVVVLREVLGGLVTDEELVAALGEVPPWLKTLT